MRFCHVSDTHGIFNKLNGNFDAVIHTGDFFANLNNHNQDIIFDKYFQSEKDFQTNWLKNNIEIIKKWVNGRDLLFTLGNHDFINPVEMEIILNENKIKAYDLNNKLITYNNINFYGFPYISYINGHFNYELDLADMNELFNNVLNVLNTSYVDVLAFHSPIYGILDLEFNTNYGSSIIFDKLKYSLDNDKIPIFYLHGHVHHYHGFDRLNIGNNILTISNAATTNHIINI